MPSPDHLKVVAGTEAGSPPRRPRWWSWKGIAWGAFWAVAFLALLFNPWPVILVGFGVAWAVIKYREHKALNELPIIGRVIVDRRWW